MMAEVSDLVVKIVKGAHEALRGKRCQTASRGVKHLQTFFDLYFFHVFSYVFIVQANVHWQKSIEKSLRHTAPTSVTKGMKGWSSFNDTWRCNA